MKGYSRIHAIANCNECNWENTDYVTSPRKAHYHHKRTGHIVNVEIGFCKHIGEKK